MSRLPRLFVLSSLVYLVAGMALGIQMGIAHDFTATPVHAHINLVGWATLGLFGLIHRAYPALSESRLAWPQFWLAQAGSLALCAGIAVSIFYQQPIIAIVGSLVLITATILFLLMALTGLRESARG